MQLEILLKSEIPYEAQEYHEHRIDTFKYVFERLFLDQYASRIVSNPVIEFEYNPVNGKFKLKSIPSCIYV